MCDWRIREDAYGRGAARRPLAAGKQGLCETQNGTGLLFGIASSVRPGLRLALNDKASREHYMSRPLKFSSKGNYVWRAATTITMLCL